MKNTKIYFQFIVVLQLQNIYKIPLISHVEIKSGFTGMLCTIEHLELVMPKYAVKGGDIVLSCEHSVLPEQLYKVEWRRGEHKIFQYIKGRKPPFRSFETIGATLNVSINKIKLCNVVKYKEYQCYHYHYITYFFSFFKRLSCYYFIIQKQTNISVMFYKTLL